MMTGLLEALSVALLAALYFTFSSGPFDAALLAFISVIRHRYALAAIPDLTPLWEAAWVIADISGYAFLLLQLLQWTRATIDTPRWDGPGKVLLFPGRTSHARMFPQKHFFSYSYLTVGIPVNFEGNAGGMVSVGVEGKRGLFSWPSWPSLAPRVPKAWFTVDAGDYLERGKSELGLRGKLDEYLRAQGADPFTYPYAYLVTAARFLGYHFNPVSFWYLYGADKRLAAMILEVNNTFDERRMYFLVPDSNPGRQIDSPGPPVDEAEQLENLPQSGARQVIFKQSWPKDFHVSPFNSRKGSYTLAASDPLVPYMRGTGPVTSTINLVSHKGHGKLVARLLPAGAAIDPYTMTRYEKLRFLASWWYVGFLTSPRIVKEAFLLFFQRKLHVWYRPEPLKDSIGRRADSTEQQLEPIFRRYLQHLVEQSTAPLVVKYIASGISQDTTQTMLSPAAREGLPADELEFKVLSPVFYTRFVYYAHDLEAFFCELNESCTIWVSRPDLLPQLALKKPPPALKSSGFVEYAYFKIIQRLRVRPERIVQPLTSSARPAEKLKVVDIREFRISSMDAYVLAHESVRAQKVYRSCVLRLFVADRISFGFVPLLEVQRVLLLACLAWLLSSAVGGMVKGVSTWVAAEQDG